MATTESPADGGEWVPIAEAAARLGVSQDAVRRRLKTGQVQGRREIMPQGFRWLILLDGDGAGETAQGGATRQVGATSPDEAPRGGAQVAELATVRAQEMAAYTEAILAPWRQRVEELAREVGELRGRLDGQAPPPPSAPSPQWAERPWWQRLLWG